jgi:hypothetical protein
VNDVVGHQNMPKLGKSSTLAWSQAVKVLSISALLGACSAGPGGPLIVEEQSVGKRVQPVQAGPVVAPIAPIVKQQESAILVSPLPEPAVVVPAESQSEVYLNEQAQEPAPAAQTPVATPAPALPVASQQVVEQLLAEADKAKAKGQADIAIMKLQQAQRIAPREPKVYARLAALYLAQGQAARAEQVSRKGLTLVAAQPAYGHFFWRLIAASRRYQGDTQGEAQALAQAQALE